MSAWSKLLGSFRYGGITDDQGWAYQFTPFDARWAIPSLAGESHNLLDELAQLWAMFNRLYLTRDRDLERRDHYRLPWPHRFGDILLSYSQPVNPYWRERGSEFLQDRREHFVTDPPSAFPEKTRWLVQQFVEGRMQIRPEFVGLTDFADCDCSGCGRDVHGPEAMRVRNCFWRLMTWPRGVGLRSVEKPRASGVVPAIVMGASAAAIGLGVWGMNR